MITASVDPSDIIDRAPVNRVQVAVFVLCALCLIIDGFDVQALGYAAPAIIQEWHVPGAVLGPVFGAANLGVLIGQLFFAMLADKVGRRPVLITGALFFGVLTILTARVTNVQELLVVRLVAGIGLGSIIPNATALTGEYSQRRRRLALMSIMGVGFTAGAALGGFIAAAVIPAFGWRSVFYLGGAVPLVLAVAMVFWLPESLQFLVIRNRQPADITRGLLRLDPNAAVDGSTTYFVDGEQRRGVPLVHLFRDGRAAGTLLIWVVNFMNLLNLYLLANWLPTVVRGSGYSVSTAVLVGTTLQVGGIAGTFLLTWQIERRGFFPVLITGFGIACLSIIVIGQPGLPLSWLVLAVFITGLGIVGSQPTLNALSGSYYPTYLRSTGIGWGLGIGRAGAIVGPVLGGLFLSWQWSPRGIFLAAAVPALISSIVMIALRTAMKSQAGAGTPAIVGG